MKTVMILGAHGGTARIATDRILKETDYDLILFLRNSDRLSEYANNERVSLIEGDVLNTDQLSDSMNNADIIYSNVGGTDLANQTKSILNAMYKANKRRLIFISALGSHREVPEKFGEWNEQAIAAFLPGFRESAKMLEDSNLIYTEIRPSWLTNNNEIDYETTTLNEPFTGTEVSRASVADFVLKLIGDPSLFQNESIGLNEPNTDGDKPSWM
ncbi:NAD(P)H-binding protein [Companilactobacillus jidongensis]|uniref:NAD(P)H-binding protein n=1 Tax=Companilactobacillus jidongensis TaxID=2486006 RepID=UPI000F798CE3|nr:NAD(P)H-binding protein [Companilactobacillus jidongensis]